MYPQKRFATTILAPGNDRVVLLRYDTSTCRTLGARTQSSKWNPTVTTYLMCTPNERYFLYHESEDSQVIEPLDIERAVEHYQRLQESEMAYMGFEEAFPMIAVEDA